MKNVFWYLGLVWAAGSAIGIHNKVYWFAVFWGLAAIGTWLAGVGEQLHEIRSKN